MRLHLRAAFAVLALVLSERAYGACDDFRDRRDRLFVEDDQQIMAGQRRAPGRPLALAIGRTPATARGSYHLIMTWPAGRSTRAWRRSGAPAHLVLRLEDGPPVDLQTFAPPSFESSPEMQDFLDRLPPGRRVPYVIDAKLDFETLLLLTAIDLESVAPDGAEPRELGRAARRVVREAAICNTGM
jgi:hypothetical protein